ncbi:hypothetical protein [Salipiger bermudensis]|uniref:hypothetical protein n=1 Tax=Salipiger bermudensis TaxID=344736 RepID=UPI00300998AE
MGYSQPKKQLDLREFLSTPAKKKPFGRKFGSAKPQAQPTKVAPQAKPDETEG